MTGKLPDETRDGDESAAPREDRPPKPQVAVRLERRSPEALRDMIRWTVAYHRPRIDEP